MEVNHALVLVDCFGLGEIIASLVGFGLRFFWSFGWVSWFLSGFHRIFGGFLRLSLVFDHFDRMISSVPASLLFLRTVFPVYLFLIGS